MTQNEIDNLITWAENNAKCRIYAENIVMAEREMRNDWMTFREFAHNLYCNCEM